MTSAPAYFSGDYRQAREKFLNEARALDLDIQSHLNDCAPGPDGAPLFTDVVTIGDPKAPAVLLIMSGTHGVEGFCGSGVQVGFLKTLKDRKIPANVRIVLIHAINPYGFAWLRRVNEDNVDLNRNFIDHELTYPENPGYEELKELISPDDISPDAMKAANAVLRAYSEEHGAPALQAAISVGQYNHPEGIYFGGTFATWSNRTFREIVAAETKEAKAVALIDLHTGLGPYGYGEPILEFPPEDPAFQRAKAWWGDSVTSTVSGDSVSPKLNGTIDFGLPEIVPHADVTTLALEFGTVPGNRVFRALRKDNWLHLHGDLDSALGREIKQELRDAFYPDTDDWKEMVWDRSMEIINKGIAGLDASVRD